MGTSRAGALAGRQRMIPPFRARWSDQDDLSLTSGPCNVHIAWMSTKTISLKQEAYERLRAARRYPTESFSEVVLRASWPEDTVMAGDLLRLYRSGRARLSDEVLDRIAALKRQDAPPEDKWAKP